MASNEIHNPRGFLQHLNDQWAHTGGEEVLERSQLQEAVFESAWNEPRDMCLTLWTDSIFFLQASEC